MNKKRVIAVLLLFAFLVINFANLIVIYKFTSGNSFSSESGITGKATAQGLISIEVLSDLGIQIIEPVNSSIHNFNLSDMILPDASLPEYPINLTVVNTTVVDFYYYLYNPSYGYYYEAIPFDPNTSIPARAGWNYLIVEGFDFLGASMNDTAWFYVNVSNSEPEINLSEGQLIYACEGSTFTFPFNVTDYDDYLENMTTQLTPKDPFYISDLYRLSAGLFQGNINSLGRVLDSSKIGNFSEKIEVSDGIYVDTKNVKIQVLDINMPPSISDVVNDQIWMIGDDRRFYFELESNDEEDGQLSDFELTYQNGSEFNLFSPNSSGVMDYSADLASPNGTYNLRVCVNDSPLSNPHENISYNCGNDGSNNQVCDDFVLIITDSNRPPIITDRYPNVVNNGEVDVNADTLLLFNVTVYDGDGGFINFDWYLDGVYLDTHEELTHKDYFYYDELSYRFYCSISGQHNLTVNASDGSAYTTHTWVLNVNSVSCGDEPPSPGGGGGGGGGGESEPICLEDWYCDDLVECINLEEGFFNGLLDTEEYYTLYDFCRQIGLNDLTCGFEFSDCIDLNLCNRSKPIVPKPNLTREVCHYVVDPSCEDGIKNCHNGSCEMLVDCGGPCPNCPNCHDGILNQGEEGIDCGGPCSNICETEEPTGISYLIIIFYWFLAILLFILILYVIYRILRIWIAIWKERHKEEEYTEKGKIFSKKSRRKRIKSLLRDSTGGEE